MFSVALIGPDGAGKTTIARMLEERSPLPLKYIYMGVNIAASNFALPTSRLFEYLRGRQNGDDDPPPVEGQKSSTRRGGAERRAKCFGPREDSPIIWRMNGTDSYGPGAISAVAI